MKNRLFVNRLWHISVSSILTAVLFGNLFVLGIPLAHAQAPSSGILDNFNRANGNPGSSWSGSTSGYKIVSNRLDVGSGGALFWGTQFGADQEVFITITTLASSGSEQALLLKSQSKTGWNSGLIEVWYDALNKRVQVRTYSKAQGWVQRGTNIPVTFVNGDQFGARAKANGTVEVYRNGILIGSRDASGWTYATNGGYIGLWFIKASSALLDDFGGGSNSTASTNTPTSTPTRTTTPSQTPTRTFTPTWTSSSTATFTPTTTFTLTNTPTFTPTQVPTDTSTNTPTIIPIHTDTEIPTSTPTETLTSTSTFIPADTSTSTSTFTPIPTETPSSTSTFTPVPTSSPTYTPSFTPTNTSTSTPSLTSTSTQAPIPTNTPTENPTNTPTFIPTETLTSTPTFTATNTLTSTPTLTPTVTPTYSPAPSTTPSRTPPPYLTGQNTYVSTVDGRKGLLFLPGNYQQAPEEGWPLIMFIHGSGSISNDPNTIRQEALPNKLDLTPNFPFIVISPLITSADNVSDTHWLSEQTTNSLMALLHEIENNYDVNPGRVYLTGYSLGGGATWKLGLQFPDHFAAIAPVAGYYKNPPIVPANICDLRNTPIWAFIGDNDPFIPVSVPQNLVNAVNNCGGNAQLTIYEGADHDIGARAYFNTNDLYNWMLQHSLSAAMATPTSHPPETATYTLEASPIPSSPPTLTSTFTPVVSLSATPTSTSIPTITQSITLTTIPTNIATITPAGFPYTIILDTFNRTNGAPGSNWSGATSGYAVASNRLDVGSGNALFWGTQFGSDQEVFVTLTTIDSAGSEQDLLLKSQSKTSWAGGVIEVWYDAVNKRVLVYTYSSAQGWVQRGTSISVTMVNGDQFGARARANGIVDVYRNGVVIGSRDTSAWTYTANGGYIGLWFAGASNAILDDFGGGTIGAGITSTPSTPIISTPTKTPTRTATSITIGTATKTATPSYTPTSIPTNTPTGTSTEMPIFTPTPTLPVGNTATPSGAPIVFALGTGGSDVIPHQIVRTNTDTLYIFANQQSSSVLRAYRTTNPGLPNGANDFSPAIQITETSSIISVDAVYDGGDIIHVIINTRSGLIKDHPFDTSSNTFKSSILLATDGGIVGSEYAGTSGVTGMFDLNGNLHLAYWTNSNHILHRAYTYNNIDNTLAPLGDFFQVDAAGSANHPILAVSPVDDSLTLLWVSEADNPAKIRARVRGESGTWGNIELASTYPSVSVWTSPDNGINIDQGPSLLIDPSGTKHMTYIESFNAALGDYGRIHYVTDSGSGWVDEALNKFSHDPALAINAAGNVYILGHGHPKNTAGSPECVSTYSAVNNMCTIRKNQDGTWGPPTLLAVPPAGSSFDSSVSVKWSVMGFNRSDVIEFIFFMTPYDSPTLYYGRLP